jgi:predicted permease
MNFDRLYIVVATLFVILAIGFLCRKVKIIDDVASKKLSRLILAVGQPAMLISSLASAEYNDENLKTALIMLILGFVFHFFLAGISFLFALPLKKNIDEQKLSEFGLMFTNCAFIGFPIFEALLPGRGQFMASFLCISFNILLWTWGLIIMGRGRKDIKLTLKKALVNFGTIPCLIGFVLFLLKNPAIGFEIGDFAVHGIYLPEFLANAAKYLMNLCTPISVLVTGALIATQSPKKIFLNPKLYYFNAVKLIVFPLIVCLISKLLLIVIPYEGLEIYAIFVTAAAALPTASSVTMMAENYGLDSGYSSLTVGTSSILAVVTIPFTMMIAQWILAL